MPNRVTLCVMGDFTVSTRIYNNQSISETKFSKYKDLKEATNMLEKFIQEFKEEKFVGKDQQSQ